MFFIIQVSEYVVRIRNNLFSLWVMIKHNKLECLFPAGFSQPRLMRVRQGAYPNRSKSVAVLFIRETLIFNPSLIFESGLPFQILSLLLPQIWENLGKYQRSSLFFGALVMKMKKKLLLHWDRLTQKAGGVSAWRNWFHLFVKKKKEISSVLVPRHFVNVSFYRLTQYCS